MAEKMWPGDTDIHCLSSKIIYFLNILDLSRNSPIAFDRTFSFLMK